MSESGLASPSSWSTSTRSLLATGFKGGRGWLGRAGMRWLVRAECEITAILRLGIWQPTQSSGGVC